MTTALETLKKLLTHTGVVFRKKWTNKVWCLQLAQFSLSKDSASLLRRASFTDTRCFTRANYRATFLLVNNKLVIIPQLERILPLWHLCTLRIMPRLICVSKWKTCLQFRDPTLLSDRVKVFMLCTYLLCRLTPVTIVMVRMVPAAFIDTNIQYSCFVSQEESECQHNSLMKHNFCSLANP